MAEFNVTPSQLESKAGDLRNLISQFRDAVNEMIGLEQRLNDSWEGEARNAFHTAFENDRRKMDTFAKNIDLYAEALERNAEAYSVAEAANTNTASTRTS